MAREQFTFYRSFWEAFRALPKRDRLPFVEAVGAYVFEDKEMPLTGPAAAAFLLVRPVLDTASKRSASGKLGGSKPKAKGKQTVSKGEAGGKQTAREKEGEKEKEDDSPPFIPPAGGHEFGAELTAALEEWQRYKAERGQGYRPTGLAALEEEVRRYAGECGEAAVAALLRRCMASGWAGIAWDKLERPGGGQEDVSWMKEYL